MGGFGKRLFLFLFCICFLKNSYDLFIVFIKNGYIKIRDINVDMLLCVDICFLKNKLLFVYSIHLKWVRGGRASLKSANITIRKLDTLMSPILI